MTLLPLSWFLKEGAPRLVGKGAKVEDLLPQAYLTHGLSAPWRSRGSWRSNLEQSGKRTCDRKENKSCSKALSVYTPAAITLSRDIGNAVNPPVVIGGNLDTVALL